MAVGIEITHKKIGGGIGFYGNNTISAYAIIAMTKLCNKGVIVDRKTIVAIVYNHKVIPRALIFYKRKKHVQI